MKKKIIKKRVPAKKANQNTHKVNRAPIKKRVTPRYTKKDNNIKYAFLVFVVVLVIASYIILNAYCAIALAIGIGIILGVAEILKRTRKEKKKRKLLRIFLIIILALGITGLLGASAFLVYIKFQADPMFTTSKLDTPENTTLLDINGNEYAKLGSEMREKITYDQLPEVLVDAIVATEDSRFFQHNGFDAPRFLKASLKQALGQSDAGGASTLSMQVVKNSLTNAKATSGIKGIIRKFEDIYLAIFKLEKNYTKEQIIEYYVNNHYLGGNVYGVEEAAETYFGKSVSELNLSEAAILAGMFKSPTLYRPTDHPENAAKRRKTVLYQMKNHGYITAEEEKIANSIPVESLVVDNSTSVNAAFQGYIDTVVKEISKKYKVNAYTTPLLVYTNLDPARQYAVNSVLDGESYDWLDDRVQTGVSVLDVQTGKILAIGNGRNINGRSAKAINQLNYATDIRRQPGSTAKPLFDYGPGIEFNDWSTYTLFDDSPYHYSNGRSINNWDGGYYGTLTLRRALAASRNIPALKAFQQVDNKKIVEFVTSLGISPEIENGRIHEAHAIGAFTGTNPLEMSAAYSAFANGGYYNEPYSVSKIVFKDTGEIKEHSFEKKQVMSDATAYMITSVLKDVVLNGGGTPYGVACKTGTTNFDEKTMQDYNMPYDAIRDSWVIGYSTKTAIGMWYGYDGFTTESIREGYVLHNIQATVQKDKLFIALVNSGAMESDREDFVQPESVVKVGIENGTNPPKLASSYSGNVIYEYFKKGTEPEERYEEEKLAKPENLKVTYDPNAKKVNITWSAVNKLSEDKNYGTFGYNIYMGSTLIGFTEKTSYSYLPKGSPYDTYRVVAVYKGYSGIQSESATFTLEEDHSINPTSLKLNYSGPTTVPADGALTLSLSNFSVTYNSSSINATIKNCAPLQITSAGKTTINCAISYEGKEYNLSTSITTTKEETDEENITP